MHIPIRQQSRGFVTEKVKKVFTCRDAVPASHVMLRVTERDAGTASLRSRDKNYLLFKFFPLNTLLKNFYLCTLKK